MSKYITDKIASGLLDVYTKLFAGIKDKPVKYFEVGVFKGGSLMWASDYFSHPDSRIYGIDTNLDAYLYHPTSQKITTILCDQNDGKQLETLGKTLGQFDVVIDDGCHREQETRNCFDKLWPCVVNGGYYVVEDWGACYRYPPVVEYAGMDLLIAEILLAARYHHIAEMSIVHGVVGGKLHSYAAFKKGVAGNG